ncbi:hypothetical protein C8J57DRAFT_1222194 [Mycena rebaudengoi]|nr:hypothetical protein C8J57DRAFT_1222194 [Mycena rebaudengoi]
MSGFSPGLRRKKVRFCQDFDQAFPPTISGPSPIYPSTGVACFERFALPAHAGRRVLLRILEILEPEVACTIQGYAGRVGWPKAGGSSWCTSAMGRRGRGRGRTLSTGKPGLGPR